MVKHLSGRVVTPSKEALRDQDDSHLVFFDYSKQLGSGHNFNTPPVFDIGYPGKPEQ
jgi:hypothetical protein